MDQAYYIVCADCNDNHEFVEAYRSTAQTYQQQLAKKLLNGKEDDIPGLTNATTTAHGSEVSTPADFSSVPAFPTVKVEKRSTSPKMRTKHQVDVFGTMMKVDKTRLSAPMGVSRKKADRMGSGTKRTFAELVGETDEVNEGDRKKGRSSLGRR